MPDLEAKVFSAVKLPVCVSQLDLVEAVIKRRYVFSGVPLPALGQERVSVAAHVIQDVVGKVKVFCVNRRDVNALVNRTRLRESDS